MDLYQTDSLHAALTLAFRNAQSRSRYLSLRRLAAKVGTSHAMLSKAFSGRAVLSPARLRLVMTELSLDAEAARYIELLQAREAQKQHADAFEPPLGLLRYRRKVKAAMASDLLQIVLREMTFLRDYVADRGWLKRRLRLSPEDRDLQRHLGDGKGEDAEAAAHEPHRQVVVTQSVAALRGMHKQFIAMASDAIEAVPTDQRFVSTSTVAIRRNDYAALIEELNGFRDSLLARYQAEKGTGDDVYQLNFQFFPHTQPSRADD